jgi:hypothetical protein
MIRQAAIIRRTAMSYDRLMQLVAEQAMQRAMVQINKNKHGGRRTSGAVPDSTAQSSRPFVAGN